ncbi:uncharacterized protein BX663DRAFT_583630 [Cokeromyces recurvatus]|uniref:uncharacterized protein n=1 Tax=Cokeromyces recurvatus TaxID=90255 RepID=UPI00221EDE4C|nr:uncharacterized protein BX663DRAFT_583630 [Cokeromyces recurvatus]KAI7905530.1 hypothetical protein BX663DRAFT_583630 [Cokeromyces recurvatus]
MRIIIYVHILRYLAFIISLISFSCHLAQCILLQEYIEKTEIPNWMTAGHWQYLSCTLFSYKHDKKQQQQQQQQRQNQSYSLDKCIGSLSFLLILSSVITAVIFDSGVTEEPWTNDSYKLEEPRIGLLTSCYTLFDSNHDLLYPLLYKRCILSDSTWICAILLCINWLSLVGFVIYQTLSEERRIKKTINKRVFNRPTEATTTTAPFQELAWGRYIPDLPNSLYSSTTHFGNHRLLVPTSILTYKKHVEFYASAARELCYDKEKDIKISLDEEEDDDEEEEKRRKNYIPAISLPTFELCSQTTSLFDDFHYLTKDIQYDQNKYISPPLSILKGDKENNTTSTETITITQSLSSSTIFDITDE